MYTYLDIAFPIVSKGIIPCDHNYILYASISKIIPSIHEADDTGIHSINGFYTGNGEIQFNAKSQLVFRTNVSRIPELLPLAGTQLNLGGCTVLLGVPRLFTLTYHSSLWSRIVSIKGFMEPSIFLEAIHRQLEILGIDPSIQVKIGKLRTLIIKDKKVVGFQVSLDGLNEKDSIQIQSIGLGGRRKMCCGLFIPNRQKKDRQENKNGYQKVI
jgi:CRISPR-associated protein Cas6